LDLRIRPVISKNENHYERRKTMKPTEKRQLFIVALSVVLSCTVLSYVAGRAGSLEPNAPPGPTMRTLDEIYDELTSGIAEREGYFKRLRLTSGASEDLFTVQDGKRFVLLQLYYHGDNLISWSLRVNGSILLDESILRSGQQGQDTAYDFRFTFPDRCVVFDPNDTLSVTLGTATATTWHIVGYFYDVPQVR
jgi:hypothetical protein